MRARQVRDKLLIRIRLRPAQLVIEMNDRKDEPQLPTQLQQKAQQGNRINPAGDGHTNAIPGTQQFMPPNMRENALRKRVHRTMVTQLMI